MIGFFFNREGTIYNSIRLIKYVYTPIPLDVHRPTPLHPPTAGSSDLFDDAAYGSKPLCL